MDLSAPHLHVATLKSVRFSLAMRVLALVVLVAALAMLALEVITYSEALAVVSLAALTMLVARANVLRAHFTGRKLNALLLEGIAAYQEGRLVDAEAKFVEVAKRTRNGVFQFHVPALTWMASMRLAQGARDDARVLIERLMDPSAATRACRGWIRASVSLHAAFLAAFERDVGRAESLLAQAAIEDAKVAELALMPRFLIALERQDRAALRSLATRAEAQWTRADRGIIDNAQLAAMMAFAERELGEQVEFERWESRLSSAALVQACEARKGLLEAPRWTQFREYVDGAIRRGLVAKA